MKKIFITLICLNVSAYLYAMFPEAKQRLEPISEEILQSQNVPYSIYKVDTVVDLEGKELTLPEGSVLDFQGGKLKNGKVKGNNSTITGILVNIFDDVILTGTYTNYDSNLAWWGCVPYSSTNEFDNSSKIQCALKSSINVIHVSQMYGISSPVQLSAKVKIEGVNSWQYKQAGFIANSDFKPIEVALTRTKKSYVVSGMFYHSFDQKPLMRDISLDANYKAKYAIEHIDGYSWCDLENVYITSALRAGVLQYAAEQPWYDNVAVYNSHIGFLVSTKRFKDEDIYLPTGEHVGMPNLVNFRNCAIGGCNYGVVVSGGSNYSFNNLKTAYNSICGVIVNQTTAYLSNYYTEGDAICNFWRDDKGNLLSVSRSRVLPMLTQANPRLDGFSSQFNTEFDSPVYYRAPVYILQSNVQVATAFISIKPRGDADSDVVKLSLPTPTENTFGGLDACFITNASCLSLSNIDIYKLSNDYPNNVAPFAFVVDLAPSNISSSNSKISMNHAVHLSGLQNLTIYSTSNSRPSAGSQCYRIDSPSYSSTRMLYDLKHIGIDFNSSLHKLKILRNNSGVIANRNPVDTYQGVPLYSNEDRIYTYLNKSVIKEHFGERRQIKMVAYIQVLEGFKGVIQFNTAFADAKFKSMLGGVGLNASVCDFYPGIYRLETPIYLNPKSSLELDGLWEYLQISLYGDKESEGKCLFSDIYFFEMEDGKMLITNN